MWTMILKCYDEMMGGSSKMRYVDLMKMIFEGSGWLGTKVVGWVQKKDEYKASSSNPRSAPQQILKLYPRRFALSRLPHIANRT